MSIMALIETTYSPQFENGTFIDHFQQSQKSFTEAYPAGVKYPCYDPTKIYTDRNKFVSHCKSNRHQRWLKDFEKEYKDPMRRLMDAERTIKNQNIIINNLENEKIRLQIELNSYKIPIDNLLG